jgi:predicted amino acid dehydrogenase
MEATVSTCSQCVLRRVKPRPEKEMFGMAHSVTSVRLKRQLRVANRENFSKVPAQRIGWHPRSRICARQIEA